MISTVPVMIILFSIILKIEKTNTFQVLGVVFSLLGVLFIISKADFVVFKNLAFEKGDLFALFAMISWSLYSALLKKKNYGLSPITLLQVVIGLGVIFLIPMYAIDIFTLVIELHLIQISFLFCLMLFCYLVSFLFFSG